MGERISPQIQSTFRRLICSVGWAIRNAASSVLRLCMDGPVTMAFLANQGAAAAGVMSSAALNGLTLGVAVAADFGMMLYKIFRDVWRWNKGKMSGKLLKHRIKMRLMKFGFTSAGCIAGFYIGWTAGPIGAVVGAIIGSLIGVAVSYFSKEYFACQFSRDNPISEKDIGIELQKLDV